jgi:hypothetical protein
MVPLLANLFVDEMSWDIIDFVVMGILIFCTGLMFQFIAGKVKNKKTRIIASLSLIIIFLYIWAELAVGIFTNLGS